MHSLKKALPIILLAALFSDAAIASSTGQWGFVTALDTFRDIISGPVAQGIAVLGIAGSAAALMFGTELNQFIKTLVTVVMVACILITTNGLVSWLTSIGGVTSTGAQIASVQVPVSVLFA